MSDTTQGIDTAAIREKEHRWRYDLNYVTGRIELAGYVLPLCDAIDTLTARLAAVERERDAARAALEHIHIIATDTSKWVSDMGIHVILTTCREALGIPAPDALTADATEGASDAGR